jgi:hypothetical protein
MPPGPSRASATSTATRAGILGAFRGLVSIWLMNATTIGSTGSPGTAGLD